MQLYEKIENFLVNNFSKNIKLLENLSNYIFSILYSLVISFSIPVLLILVAIVEFNRVRDGLVIANNPSFSALMALVLISSFVVMEMIIVYIKNEIEYTQKKKNFGYYKQKVKDIFNSKVEEKEQLVIVLKQLVNAKMFVFFAIVLSSTAGVLANDPAISTINYKEFFSYINDNSSIVDLIKYLDIFFLSIVFLILDERFAEYTARRFFVSRQSFDEMREEIENKGIITLRDYIARNVEKLETAKLSNLDNENDLINVDKNSFYDSVTDEWSREYSAEQSLINYIYRANNKRKKIEEI